MWAYYRAHKRSMPWRETRDPYRILVSEIMLQQTQVSRVVIFYEHFLKTFPTLRSLARAPLSDILRVWQGLGYNRRARYLKLAAEEVVKTSRGILPREKKLLIALPGIGEATAGAILTYAHNTATPFIETNVRRVFIHHFFPRHKKVSDIKLMPLVEHALDKKNPREWYYALMDYGSFLAKTVPNPNRRSTHYVRQKPFAGSDREARGVILRLLLEKPGSEKLIGKRVGEERALRVLRALIHEGFIVKTNSQYALAG